MAILIDPKKSNIKKIRQVPLVTLREGVIFPHTDAVLSFGRPASLAGVNKAIEEDGLIAFVSQRKATTNEPKVADLYKVGTLCKIDKTMPINEEVHAIVQGIVRVKIEQVTVNSDKTLSAVVVEIDEDRGSTDKVKALVNHMVGLVKKAVNLGKSEVDVSVFMRIVNISSPNIVTDQVASILKLKNGQRQRLLEELDLVKRIEKIIEYLNQELKVLQLERKIATKTQKTMDKNMREAILRERMRTIQKELGESEEGEGELMELRKKIKKAKLPKEAKKKVNKELKRLARLSPQNPESGYLRSWLETIVEIPWSKRSKTSLSIKKAKKVLADDHYGLKEVKERILEYLAVMKLKQERKIKDKDQTLTPTIICFVGPPGVGKTSVGKSIARSLGRKFVRLALGGIRDEAEIRGHRRTYVGAMPGRVVQALIDAEVNNPVMMMDEVDKIGADYRGDPSAALLEVLDPEQNKAFVDHYVDTPIDLSKVLFITTANVLDTIPPALRDRLEIIRFSGYTEEEKINIAKRHLMEKELKSNGLTDKDVVITDPAMVSLVKNYTREAGVRNLEREISKIYRKVARKIAEENGGTKRPIMVEEKNLNKYLGQRRYSHTLAEEKNEVGISTGLAYTETGGDILFIEVALMEGKGNIILTGQLGDVMKESAKAALSYVRSRAKELGIDGKRFAKTDVHIHVPEGAVPKDGPSAGAAITTALVSAFTKRPTNRLIGMTGEVTLRGRVTEIGGVKEKVIAGHRAGLKEIVLPMDNKKDLVDVPSKVKKEMKFKFAKRMDDVLGEVLIGK